MRTPPERIALTGCLLASLFCAGARAAGDGFERIRREAARVVDAEAEPAVAYERSGFDLDLGDLPERVDLDLGTSPVAADSTIDTAAALNEPIDLSFDASLDYSMGMMQDAGAPKPAAVGGEELAKQATNPVAPLVQLQFQNSFVGENKGGSGYSNQFVIQPVIPWKIGSQAMLSRITVPLIATADLGGDVGREYGLGEVVALNFAITTINKGDPKWQAMIGPGVTFTLPTNTSDFTGSGKFQAGPGFIYLNTASKRVQWGAFCYQQWSFASTGGDSGRPEQSKFFFQPILVYHFDGGYYVGLQDILWSIDWNDNDRWDLQTGIRFGKVTKSEFLGGQPLNLFVMPFYNLSGNNKGNEWGVKLNLTLLFPDKTP